MFNKQNFCHVASNNRNEQKAGIFVYKTTDTLATITASGYFNEKLVDINLHDLIIHEQTDNADKTKVKYNILAVTERTLDNVGTTVIKKDWETDIETAVESLQDDIETIQDDIDDIKAKDTQQDGRLNTLEQNVAYKTTDFKTPITSTNKGITQTEETALNNKIDLAANSGRMITDQGVWYAKMYAATVAPSAENGTNYADFSQTDGQGNPIIVTYNRVNGAWVQDQTITPPAEYDGYVPITSKIWDIVEQSGQQGGRVLWNHQSKEFTPYPQIISFEDIEITGDSTVDMPQNPGANQIVNKDYVDEAIAEIPTGGSGLNVGDIFYTMRNDNELNGAVECNGTIYNTTDFTGAESIRNLLATGKIDYISLTDYETEISTKGWCDKIGWDGTGNTQFRVPTLNAYIWQKLQMGVIGDGTPLGFNYNGDKAIINAHNENLGNNRGWVKARVNGNDTSVGDLAVSTDAAQSGLLAGTSTDISQQRVMIQLATATTDEALETCTGVLADVAALKYDYVVDFQAPTAANNYTWYRKYKSGWVEQGGIYDNGSLAESVETTITMPVVMSNNMYSATATASVDTGSSSYTAGSTIIFTHSTTQLGIAFWRASSGCKTRYINWQVSGMSAS